jgi:hypothetical protein
MMMKMNEKFWVVGVVLMMAAGCDYEAQSEEPSPSDREASGLGTKKEGSTCTWTIECSKGLKCMMDYRKLYGTEKVQRCMPGTINEGELCTFNRQCAKGLVCRPAVFDNDDRARCAIPGTGYFNYDKAYSFWYGDFCDDIMFFGEFFMDDLANEDKDCAPGYECHYAAWLPNNIVPICQPVKVKEGGYCDSSIKGACEAGLSCKEVVDPNVMVGKVEKCLK